MTRLCVCLCRFQRRRRAKRSASGCATTLSACTSGALCARSRCGFRRWRPSTFAALSCQLLHASSLAPDVHKFISATSLGSPLWVQQIVHCLHTKGFVTLSKNHRRVSFTPAFASAKRSQLSSIHDIVLAQVEELSETQRWLLKLGAIIGSSFQINELFWLCHGFSHLQAWVDGDTLQWQLGLLCKAGYLEVRWNGLFMTLTYLLARLLTVAALRWLRRGAGPTRRRSTRSCSACAEVTATTTWPRRSSEHGYTSATASVYVHLFHVFADAHATTMTSMPTFGMRFSTSFCPPSAAWPIHS